MTAKKKRHGRPPQAVDEKVAARPEPRDDGYPLLSLRHLQPRFGVEEMARDQRSEFLVKWAKRSKLSWTELRTHNKHGLGFEMLPHKAIKPSVPEVLEETKYMVFRHAGNLPVAGFRAGDTFYALWIETRYGDLYDHG